MLRISRYFILILLLFAPAVWSQAPPPSTASTETGQLLFKITLSGKETILNLPGTDSAAALVFTKSDIQKSLEGVNIKGQPFIGKEGFILDGKVISPDSIGRIVLEVSKDLTTVSFYSKPETKVKIYRSRRQNEIGLLHDVAITSEQFIRGSVVSFWSNIHIDGEINEDVISVYGDIIIGDNAVIRGNIVAINGNITVSKKATIYGSIQSSNIKNRFRFDKWQKWYRKDRYLSPIVMMYYNRVDGFAPYLGVRFMDEDSLLPKVEAYGGYGFAASRWRFHFGVEQTFLKTTPVTIGGSYYRKLESNDDWIISESENSILAVLAKEDYKDYFEAEGGYGFARITFFSKLSYEIGIQSEKYKWLNGHRRLWSIFGGSKRFPENFRSVVGPYRTIGMAEIDGKEITSIKTRVAYKPLMPDTLFGFSYWSGSGELEWAPKGGGNDFNFRRYNFQVKRHQVFNAQTGIIIKAIYGGSDDYLPLERKFFLGGLGTLYGYDQKEFMGTQFWMGGFDYGIRFPNSELVGWALYEVGQIAEAPGKLGDAEFKHSLGIGLSLNEDIKMTIAKRLDRSGASPLIYVRFQQKF
ncbi:exported hypothetical protein [Candidatus Zixiibacteriota bacterium]|nr:exported hypothetical protein [candidate division Zixibacteria bacterium]